MDLWIRSQDRKDLVAIDGRLSITRVPTEKYNVEDGYRIEHFSFLLGIYKTEKRTLEVLDEIQEVIKWIQKDMKYTTIGDMNRLKGSFEDYVYEMPKEQ